MVRLIDVEDVDRIFVDSINGHDDAESRLKKLASAIDNAPDVDIEAILWHGYWRDDNPYWDCVCSVCAKGLPIGVKTARLQYKYCPMCGACMDAKDGVNIPAKGV